MVVSWAAGAAPGASNSRSAQSTTARTPGPRDPAADANARCVRTDEFMGHLGSTRCCGSRGGYGARAARPRTNPLFAPAGASRLWRRRSAARPASEVRERLAAEVERPGDDDDPVVAGE